MIYHIDKWLLSMIRSFMGFFHTIKLRHLHADCSEITQIISDRDYRRRSVFLSLVNAPKVFGSFFLYCTFFFVTAFLHGQTAAEMDVLLETRALSFVQAVRFTLVAADILDEGTTAEDAYALARERGWLPNRAEADNPIRLGELCFLMMNAYNLKGSFLYALFPGPRYAFREFNYLKLIPGRRDPALRVSGEGFLQILGRVTAYTAVEKPQETASTVMTKREEMAEIIQSELKQLEVKDTTVRIVQEGIAISLNNIQFMPDSVELTEPEKVKLREIAIILSRYPDRKLLVRGHTAMAGTPEGQLRISAERAAAVADFLAAQGVRRRESIIVEGYGARRPLGDNATAEGQALNRRVEITLLDE
jgi:outer membrane protein OmpA-like peptidoglycan-associated protein